jgi:lysophospholipase L1-like esterase
MIKIFYRLFIITVLFQLCLPEFSLFAQDPHRFSSEVAELSKINIKSDTSQHIILFTGSSSIRMWKDLQSYFPDKKIINTGFGGSHMSDLLYFADSLIFQFSPKQIFIYEGDNDIADKESPDSIIAETKLLVARIKKKLPQTDIVLISPKPSILRWNLREEYRNLNNLLSDFASQSDKVRFIDVWPIMLDSDSEPKKNIFLDDGLHMNKSGYDLWAKEIRKFIR